MERTYHSNSQKNIGVGAHAANIAEDFIYIVGETISGTTHGINKTARRPETKPRRSEEMRTNPLLRVATFGRSSEPTPAI